MCNIIQSTFFSNRIRSCEECKSLLFTVLCTTMEEDEDVIVIEDSDDDDVMVIEHSDDEDVLDHEVMVIADSDEEWDNILEALEDSDYNSDSDNEYVEETHRVLDQADIISVNEIKKMCSIYFYYKTGDYKFCTACFIRIGELYPNFSAVRIHETACYSLILGQFCNECRFPLHQIMPCNMCPICIP